MADDIATEASAGPGTPWVTPERSPPGTFGVAIIRDKKPGKGLRYAHPRIIHAAADPVEQRA